MMYKCDSLVFSCFAHPLARLRVEVVAQLEALGWRPGDRLRIESDDLDLDRIYTKAPPPGGAHLKRVVLFAPRAAQESTVLVANLQDGWNSLVHCVAVRLRVFAVQVFADKSSVRYPKNAFYAWRDGEFARAVRSMLDGERWEFFESGEPLEFENTDYYTARLKKKRVTPEILAEYMSKIGWDFMCDDFWSTDQDACYLAELHH